MADNGHPYVKLGGNPKLTACAADLVEDFLRNWRRRTHLAGADVPEPPADMLAATLYSLLYSGLIVCPKPEHRIGTRSSS
jgi:hypothetical protein